MKKEITKKIDTLWRIVFYVLFLMSLPVVIGLLFAPEISGVEMGMGLKIISLVLLFINLLGIYGFAWKRRILSVLFWKLFFVAIIISNIYYVIVGIEGLELTSLADIIATSILSIMFYLPIYLYTFRSKNLWEGGVSVDKNK